jgi:GDPmannose 4,6-dehydratase
VRALVTGAAGQDGTLLCQLLRSRGFEVLGLDAGSPKIVVDGIRFGRVDVSDATSLRRAILDFEPDQIYHLAACHHSSEETGDVALDRRMVATNFGSTETLVATVAEHLPACRVLYAASSQMYTAGAVPVLVDENTPVTPSTFYGMTKSWSRQLLAHYRQSRGVYCGSAILFNHESPLRPPQFVTRKITSAAARAKLSGSCDLHLRDVSARTDWSSARDVVAGMCLALSAPLASDYVIASGEAHSVGDVLEAAFGFVGLDWRDHATFDPAPASARAPLIGNPSRLEAATGWRRTVSFECTIEEMVAADIALLADAPARDVGR